jgi:hypothetical protein
MSNTPENDALTCVCAGGARQREEERRALVRLRFQPNFAAVMLDDALA